jgi:aminopeptidase
MDNILNKYAQLLVNYSLNVQPNERVMVSTTTLAEPLVREVYREILKAGGHPHIDMNFRDQNRIFMDTANDEQLAYISPLYAESIEAFECYLFIRAPYNTSEMAEMKSGRSHIFGEARAYYDKVYSERTATRELKRNLCEFPTNSMAQNAGMSLDDYEAFIYNACFLNEKNPAQKWLEVRANQQKIVDLLNAKDKIQYKGDGIDISFSTKGRTWINSDGQTNMPSGEVYSAPIEDSMNGVIYFDYPAIRMGEELQGVTLWVENGEVQKWEAKKGQHILNKVFTLPGAKRFGEVAIGTNHNITKPTKNILFDEKMGGTVHMAIGQTYLQCGGKNQSSIHWDMIAEMRNGGEIYADDELIYKSGQFLF